MSSESTNRRIMSRDLKKKKLILNIADVKLWIYAKAENVWYGKGVLVTWIALATGLHAKTLFKDELTKV